MHACTHLHSAVHPLPQALHQPYRSARPVRVAAHHSAHRVAVRAAPLGAAGAGLRGHGPEARAEARQVERRRAGAATEKGPRRALGPPDGRRRAVRLGDAVGGGGVGGRGGSSGAGAVAPWALADDAHLEVPALLLLLVPSCFSCRRGGGRGPGVVGGSGRRRWCAAGVIERGRPRHRPDGRVVLL